MIGWDERGPAVLGIERGCDDAAIVAKAGGRRRIGLDVPLGWPEAFRAAIGAHARFEPWAAPADTTAARDRVAFRHTDLDVRARTGHRPMSVAADSIALVALRAAGLCERLRGELGIEIDRSGVSGAVCEVYPGGLLRVWGEHPGGYGAKAARRAGARDRILTALERRAGLVISPEERHRLATEPRSDPLDSVLCALLAGMVERGETLGPPAELRGAARVEGWIHLPPPDPGDRRAVGRIAS